MRNRTEAELRVIRKHVSLVGHLSDSIVHLGPMRLGIDGVLAWIPGVGEIYSFGAGAFIMAEGVRAGVPAAVLVRAALVLFARTLGDVVPIAGPLFADVFTAHRWAANMIVAAIDERLGVSAKPQRRRWWSGRAPVAA